MDTWNTPSYRGDLSTTSNETNMESNNSVGKEEQACVNPIEDQRRQALEHYNEVSTKCSHFSSFVWQAIRAYNPQPLSPQSSVGVESNSLTDKANKILTDSIKEAMDKPTVDKNDGQMALETRQSIKGLAQKYADEWNCKYPTKAFMKWDDYWAAAATAFDYFKKNPLPLSPPTVDKEAIYEQFRKALNINDMSGHGSNPFILKCIEICQSFSSLQNSELRKENEELKSAKDKITQTYLETEKDCEHYEDKSILLDAKVSALRQSNEEKDKEIAELKENKSHYVENFKNMTARCNSYVDEVLELQQEISSLNEILSQKMELLRKANERIEELEKQIK